MLKYKKIFIKLFWDTNVAWLNHANYVRKFSKQTLVALGINPLWEKIQVPPENWTRHRKLIIQVSNKYKCKYNIFEFYFYIGSHQIVHVIQSDFPFTNFTITINEIEFTVTANWFAAEFSLWCVFHNWRKLALLHNLWTVIFVKGGE